MPGDLMDSAFGVIKHKKEALRDDTLSDKKISDKALSDETLRHEGINANLLNESIKIANSKRRMIGVWSPLIAAAMWYLKSTIPRFSISEMASTWIEAGLERDYPELIKKLREEIEK